MDKNLATTWSREDRDLLIELRTEMKGMRSDLKEMKEDTRVVHVDHEDRIRIVEDKIKEHGTLIKVWGSVIAAALTLAQVVSSFVK